MKSKKNIFITLLFIGILLISNISIVMAEIQSAKFEKSYITSGYAYEPKWNGNIKKLGDVMSEMNYEFQENKLVGTLNISYEKDSIQIPLELIQDNNNSNLYHGLSKFTHRKKMKNVDMVVETSGNKIKKISLMIDKEVAYNLGNDVSYDEMIGKVKEVKSKLNKNVRNVSSSKSSLVSASSVSSDPAIIGSSSSDSIYAHTTLKPMSVGEQSWMATRVYTTKSHVLSHISKVVISGTKSGSAYDLLYVRPSGNRTSSITLSQYAFYWALGNYLNISFPVNGYNGSNSASDWEHTYRMWDDWDNHIFTNNVYDDNGIVSDVRLEKLSSGWVSGDIVVDVTEYITATGYFYHSLNYSYSKAN